MRINSINSSIPVYKNSKASKLNQNNSFIKGQLKVISMSEYMNSSVSFRGRNKEQAIFYGAEVAPFSKAGGVGVVMKDYGTLLDAKDEVVVSPYYRAEVDKKTGKVTPLKDDDGDYVLLVGKDKVKLDLVAEKTMQWGKEENNKIMLFNVRDEKEKVHYFVFDEATAHYSKPYENKTVYASGSKSETNGWNGDPYARHSKAFVELLPDLIASKKDFNPATVVCSDAQTAYTHEYMVQKVAKKDKDYDEIKTTHVGHNLGPGYCGETSMQNMFVNLGATPKQIEMIEADPIYKQGILGDKYFKPFVKETIDETGTASATQIALHHASKDRANGEGFVKSFSVVAEDYAESIANNPQTAYNIHKTANKLYKDGIFNGILNPLEDTSVDATKKLPNARYNEDCIEGDKTYPAFELYPQNASYEDMRRVKNTNKQRLLERLSAQDSTIITGSNRTANINPEAKGIYDGPVIRPELIEMIKNGEGDKVPLFISWGRIDTQKGHDISLEAFKEFAKTEEGKNAIFILGAGLDKGAESKKIEEKVTELLKDPDLQGRLVHIEGWAPAYAMSSGADAAVFTSRFEPCGLTDIEAMKYYCSPIVTNTQGFKQKNFDPRLDNEKDKATSLKTQHEFDLLKSQVDIIIDGYVNGNEEAKAKVKVEFPIFQTIEGYDDSAFIKFAEEYKEFIDGKKASLKAKFGEEKNFPKGWNDWNELSKNYAFKYTGFARDLKDTILAKETARAMSDYVKLPQKTKEKMFENLKTLDTTWKGNASLHPDTNKSSFKLYKERHMMSDYSAPTKSDIIAKNDSFVKKQIETRQKDDMKSRIGTYVIGALTGLSGILLARTKEKPANTGVVQEELRQQIKNLEQKLLEQETTLKSQINKLTKSNKKNMVIVGIISAIGGAAVTFLASKLLSKKTADKPQATTNVKVDEQSIAKTQTEQTNTTPSKTTETNLLNLLNK